MSPEGKRSDRLAVAAALVLAAIPFFLGKYFEFNQPDPFDSGGHVHSAQRILNGARIGVDEIPSAQVGTLLVNILGVRLGGFNEIGPKAIQGILQAAALILMFLAMRAIFGPWPAVAGAAIASFYLSAPLLAKFGNVKEQDMIAFMVAGVSCFVLYQTGGKRWLAVVAGALLAWPPLFKETGISAVAATALFVLAQPLLGHKSLKEARTDALLLLAGALAAVAPVYIWILGWGVKLPLPYSFVWTELARALPGAAAAPDYVTSGRKAVSWAQQAPVVLRYYGLLLLPIALAAASIVSRIAAAAAARRNGSPQTAKRGGHFVVLLAAWWLLDMAFVWISPRPYEQYYLPLNASAAFLGGYVLALGWDGLAAIRSSFMRGAAGAGAIIITIALSQHIFFGIRTSPFSGTAYGVRQRGYIQKFREISALKDLDRRRRDGSLEPRLQSGWEDAGDYINRHSRPADTIYVWGWVPGIYVRAQRFSASPVAGTSEMHVYPPPVLSREVAKLLAAFQRTPPRFIVDTHNRHFPYDRRPPLELWPSAANGARLIDNLPQDRDGFFAALFRTFDIRADDLTNEGFLRPGLPEAVVRYEAAYAGLLRERIGEDEALRFEAMKPLREFVLTRYHLARMFGGHVVFEAGSPAMDNTK